MKIFKRIILVLLGLAVAAVFYFGELKPYLADDGSDPLNKALKEAEEAVEETPYVRLPEYVVTYNAAGENWYSEKVTEGRLPREELTVPGCRFLGWLDESGAYVDVASREVYCDAVYTASIGPDLVAEPAGYFAPDSDGLFYPERPLVRSEFACIIYNILDSRPSATVKITDVKDSAPYKDAVAFCVKQGYMELSGDNFRPNIEITVAELRTALIGIFRSDVVDAALANLSEPVTRGEAAIAVNALLGLETLPSGAFPAYYPDTAPALDCYYAVCLAGDPSSAWADPGKHLAPGFINIDGWLYCIDSDGFFVKNDTVGMLSFGPDFRYTSGNPELDELVADRIAAIMKEKPDLSREELLKAVYGYIRDNNLYLRGNYYEVGETGWEIDEAIKILSTNKGNCYSFAAGFWALARGVGYDAVCLSGLISHTWQDHGWVEIEFDGVPYVFDVEQEGIYYRQGHGDYSTSMYKMDYERASQWSYVRDPADDPRPDHQPASSEG